MNRKNMIAYPLYAMLYLFLVASCGENHKGEIGQKGGENPLIATLNRKDSASNALLNKLHEPEIRKYKSEIYRFTWTSSFNWCNPALIFTLQTDSGNHYLLSSKMFIIASPGEPVQWYIKKKLTKLHEVTILDSESHIVAQSTYHAFNEIIQRSRYWITDDTNKKNDMYLDGDYLTFECMANCCSTGSMRYYRRDMHVPLGAMREAYRFLALESGFTKTRKGYRRWIDAH